MQNITSLSFKYPIRSTSKSTIFLDSKQEKITVHCYTIDLSTETKRHYDNLLNSTLFPKIHFAPKKHKLIAGFGICIEDKYWMEIADGDDLTIFSFCPFEESPSSPLWKPYIKHLIPRWVINEETKTISLFFLDNEDPNAFTESLNAELPRPLNTLSASFLNTTPSFKEWNTWFNKLSTYWHKLDKVVLSRTSTYHVENLDSFKLFKDMSDPTSHSIYYAIDSQNAFGCISPETLFYRNKNTLHVDLLAGTSPHHKSLTQITSKKLHEEFSWVENAVVKQLSPICENVTVSPLSILHYKSMSHLKKTVTATLKSDLTDKKLVQLLHPTPALGGFPRDVAKKFIIDIERRPRGLYGAPIGLRTKNSSLFAVGIRSFLHEEKRLHAFSGVGIITKSTAADEWNELNTKIEAIEKWLQVSTPPMQRY